MDFDLHLLFQKSDLIPVIIQDADTLEVLMLGFTNREAVELTDGKYVWLSYTPVTAADVLAQGEPAQP